MITRIVKMTFRPEHAATFEGIFSESVELIGAFDGCLGVKLVKDLHSPEIYFTISNWQSEEKLNIYRASELFVSTWSKVKPLFAVKAEAWSLADTLPN